MIHPKFAPRRLRFLCLIGIALFALQHVAWSQGAAPARPESMTQFGRLPLVFEPNQGQTDPRVRFQAHGAGYTLFLTDTGAVFSFASPAASVPAGGPPGGPQALRLGLLHSPGAAAPTEPTPKRREYSSLRMELAGARTGAPVSGEDGLPGTVNYLFGNDPARWRTAVPTFAKVRYAGVYPGVDLVYYGNRRQLEYDFVVSPGADAGQIRLRFDGANSLSLDMRGNLDIHTGESRISFHKPLIYQSVDGKRLPVSGSFQLASDNSVRFELGDYDHSRPLVIDPILSYSTYVGNATNNSGATAIAVNSAGEAYITGWVMGSDFPTTPGVLQPAHTIAIDTNSMFVAKLNAAGTALEYSTYLGGNTPGIWPYGIAFDKGGNAFVAGVTSQTDFPTTPGAFQKAIKPGGTQLGFVTKLNPTGSKLLYSTLLGGDVSNNVEDDWEVWISGIAVDAADHAYVTGYTLSKDFPVTPGAIQKTINPANTRGTTFATEFNAEGTGLVYSTLIGGSNWDIAQAISLGPAGEIVVGGFTGSSDFPITPGVLKSKYQSDWGFTGYVSEIDPVKGKLVFSTYLGGSSGDMVTGLSADAQGDVYAAGETWSFDFPVTPGAFQVVKAPNTLWISFVSKIAPGGKKLDYATYVGGSYKDEAYSLGVDASGKAYITGDSWSLDYPVTSGALKKINYAELVSLDLEPFLTVLDPTGSSLVYSSYIGGSGSMVEGDCGCVAALALDTSGNAYVVGRMFSADLPTTPGAFFPTLEADQGLLPWIDDESAAFVMKFNADEMRSLPATTTRVHASPNPQLIGEGITFTAQVLPPKGGAIPTGWVGFDLDYYSWGTAALDATGKAVYAPPKAQLSLGPHSMIAFYMGDAKNAPSNAPMTENIVLIPTTVTLTASANSVQRGTPVTFNATVTGIPPNPVPTGTVAILLGAAPNITMIGNVKLDKNAHAAFTSSALPVGTNLITAYYEDSVGLHQQNSTSLNEKILPPGVLPSPIFSLAPGTYAAPQAVKISELIAGAAIHYTLDGSTPTASSRVYSGAISVTKTTTIKAIATETEYTTSAVSSATYTIE